METKEAYRQKIEAQLKEWDAKVEELKARAERKKAESHIAFNRQMEELTQKRDRLKAKLVELEKAGEGAWRSLKEGINNAVEGAKESLKSAFDRMHSPGE